MISSVLIHLSKGKTARISLDDIERIAIKKWSFDGRYAFRNGKKKIYMHREILGSAPGVCVDHINGDKLDNRRSNLRECTKSENALNSKTKSNNALGIKGVSYTSAGKRLKRFVAQISLNGKHKFIGNFLTAKEAADAYQKETKLLHGQFHKTT